MTPISDLHPELPVETACYLGSRNFIEQMRCDFLYQNYFGPIWRLRLILPISIALFIIIDWILKKSGVSWFLGWKKIILFITALVIVIIFLQLLFHLFFFY